MKTVRTMLFIPVMLAALTTLGMEATALAEKNPSPVALIGNAQELPFAFVPYDGKQLND